MSVSPIARTIAAAMFVAGISALTSCNSSGGPNKTPRATTVPPQSTTGGTMFSLDLATYVTDPEGTPLTYTIVSGGGSFAGSMYSNVFPMLGERDVTVRATDTGAKFTDITFKVTVTQATFVVMKHGTSLLLLDDGSADQFTQSDSEFGYTASIVLFSNAQGLTDTFRASLTAGHVVYERSVGGQTDLYVYDQVNSTTTKLVEDLQMQTDELYVAKTTDNRIIFTSGTGSDTDLFIHNTLNGFTTAISSTPNQHDRNAKVTVNGDVFYERGVSGQSDIYQYHVANGSSSPISIDAANEVLLAVLPNGGIVFSRVGGSSETDLYYYNNGTGVVEIGSDLGLTIQDETKTYNAVTSDNRVVFTHDAGGDTNIYAWNSATLTTAVVTTNAANEAFRATTANNKIVYTRDAGGQDDLYLYDAVNDTTATISTDAGNEIFRAVSVLNDVVFTRENGAGDGLYMWDDNPGALRTIQATGGGDYTFEKALDNGNVAYSHSTGVFRYDATALTNTTVGGATYSFGGETSGGDFVVSHTVTAQEDLELWDESASSLVTISADADDESFGVGLTNGRVLFFRNVSGATEKSIYAWNPNTLAVNRVSNVGVDHTVVTTFVGTAQ